MSNVNSRGNQTLGEAQSPLLYFFAIITAMNEKKKFYITTPIYYANDKPHIGSAYPTIAADVIARYHRNIKGEDVLFLAGTAEHGTKITRSAEKAGKSPQEFVDKVSSQFRFAWKKLFVQPDDFIRTTEKRHIEAVEIFFEKLKATGKIYEADYEGLYCVGHEAFIKESELNEQGLCPDHKTKPELVKERNWFFKLSEYQNILRQKIEKDELAIEPEFRKNEVLTFIDRGLEDIAISRRNVPFAIPLPWDKDQTIYVWLDELFNYCSAVGYGHNEERFKKFWPADVHLVGKDIIKFHCIIWPALLLAIGEAVPKKVFAHGFFTIDGQKISKTIGNVIDPVELAEKYGADAVRYFVLREIPFGYDGDFSREKFNERYTADLANDLGNLISRVTNLIEKNCDGQVPKPVETPKRAENLQKYIEEFKLHDALAEIWKNIKWANQYVDQSKLWELPKKDPELFLEVISSLAALLKQISLELAPFLPETATKIDQILNADSIKKSEPLFPRLNT